MDLRKKVFVLFLALFVNLSAAFSNELKDLENRIAYSESQFVGLRQNVQKKFTWSRPEAPGKTDYAIVYLHGFSATGGEAGMLVDRWAEMLGANTFSTRLAGHGFQNPDALNEATPADWVNDADKAIEIGKKVIVIGKSTGASAALQAVHKSPEGIERILLVSPNFGINRLISRILSLP